MEISAMMLPHPAGKLGGVPEFAKRNPDLEQAEFVKRQRRQCLAILWPGGKRLDPDIVRNQCG
jgi:hypothetical protein